MTKNKVYEIRISSADCCGDIHWFIAEYNNGWFSTGHSGISKTVVGAGFEAIKAYRKLTE